MPPEQPGLRLTVEEVRRLKQGLAALMSKLQPLGAYVYGDELAEAAGNERRACDSLSIKLAQYLESIDG